MTALDHFVFAASDLDVGVEWLSDALGQAPSGGGRHALMGTHNKLWRLGGAYLEMIAIDPEAAPPGRPRWYGLDSEEVHARLAGGPVLLTWVIRTVDLAARRAAARRDPGAPLRVTRDALYWDLAVPEDGGLIWRGVQPTLICWPAEVSPPSETLPDTGLRLERLTAWGPREMGVDLASLGANEVLSAVDFGTEPRLTLQIRRADGTFASFRS